MLSYQNKGKLLLHIPYAIHDTVCLNHETLKMYELALTIVPKMHKELGPAVHQWKVLTVKDFFPQDHKNNNNLDWEAVAGKGERGENDLSVPSINTALMKEQRERAILFSSSSLMQPLNPSGYQTIQDP